MTELPSDLVRTLLAAVDAGTFDAAAAALHVTPSAVSQRIRALEQRTGRVLLTRTKPVRPTESGEVVLRHARQLAVLEHDARAALGIATGPSRVSIAVNADSLATWFLPALTRVPQDPPISFDLHREDESRTAALLSDGRVMAAVTSAATPVTGCTTRPLGRARYLPVCTPAFAARHLPGPLPDHLPHAPVVAFDRHDDLQDTFVRTLTGGLHTTGPTRHHLPSSESFRDAVLAGLGWGLVPEPHARTPLSTGALVELTPGKHVDVPLHWQQWKLDVPALATTAATILAAAAEALYSE